MSVSTILNDQNPNNSLKTDIKDFIVLLQKNQSLANGRRKFSLDSDKLSIIYSASEPQSSLTVTDNKQNSHNSANNNNNNNSNNHSQMNSNSNMNSNNINKLQQFQQFQNIIKQIKRFGGLNAEQIKLIDRLCIIMIELRKNMSNCQTRFRIIQSQFQEEKQETDQILKALMKLDQAQKQLWSNYSQLSTRYSKLQQKCIILQQDNQTLRKQLDQNNKDIDFMRKLVLVANQNYQNIQRKCQNLQRNTKMLQRFKQQRSSPEITSRSTIVSTNINNGHSHRNDHGQKKSSCSPSISDRSNMSVQKGSFQDNYRKLVLRTLKSKALR